MAARAKENVFTDFPAQRGASRGASDGGGGESRGSAEVPRGGQVAPWCARWGRGMAALLRPARAAHAVTIKSRQHVRVLSDRQW